MSQKRLQYDSFARLAQAVADVLADASEPLRPKDIGRELRRRGWGDPPTGAVEKVLTQYLSTRAGEPHRGRWRLRPSS